MEANMAKFDFFQAMLSLKGLLEENKVEKAIEFINELVSEAERDSSEKK